MVISLLAECINVNVKDMKMSKYELNIKHGSVSVKIQEMRKMRDEETGELVDMPTRTYRKAIGLGDCDQCPVKFKDKVYNLLVECYGDNIALMFADISTISAERDVAVKVAQDAIQACNLSDNKCKSAYALRDIALREHRDMTAKLEQCKQALKQLEQSPLSSS